MVERTLRRLRRVLAPAVVGVAVAPALVEAQSQVQGPPAYSAIAQHYTDYFGSPLEGSGGKSLGGSSSSDAAPVSSMGGVAPPTSFRVPKAGPREPPPTAHTGTCEEKSSCSCCVAMHGCGWCRPGLFAEAGTEAVCMVGTAAGPAAVLTDGPGPSYAPGCEGHWDFNGTWSCSSDVSAAECDAVAEPELLSLPPEVANVKAQARLIVDTATRGKRSDFAARLAWWKRAAETALSPHPQGVVSSAAEQALREDKAQGDLTNRPQRLAQRMRDEVGGDWFGAPLTAAERTAERMRASARQTGAKLPRLAGDADGSEPWNLDAWKPTGGSPTDRATLPHRDSIPTAS